MNTKNLIIAFITVSVAALIVSAFAVFAAARSLSEALLASATEAEEIRVQTVLRTPETTRASETSKTPESPQTSIAAHETTAEIPETEKQAEGSSAEESPSDAASEAEESQALPEAYTLKLEGSRLVMTAPSGELVCERIIDSARLHPKDREALESGIAFPNEAEAMSAVCDIIS